jgi:hypothetical protein
MKEDEALKIIQKNGEGKSSSFIHSLHAKSEFSESLFWELYDGIVFLAERDAKKEILDRQLSREITRVFAYTLTSFCCHNSPRDELVIKNLPEENLQLYIERLNSAVDGYLAGYVIPDEKFELQRPLN